MSDHSYETIIMDLVDTGGTIDQIVAKTGYARSTVECTVARLRVRGGLSDFDRASRQGSINLLSALRRVHPERCGA
jgi:hypothetical protein